MFTSGCNNGTSHTVGVKLSDGTEDKSLPCISITMTKFKISGEGKLAKPPLSVHTVVNFQ